MEELIFFGVIILFSILESIARSRKARSGGDVEMEGLPDPRQEAEWEMRRPMPEPDEVPTFDEDPSYDERAGAGGSPTARRDAPMPMRNRGSAAETMLPAELLEELAELAGRAESRRSREQARPVESPRHGETRKKSPRLPDADEWRRRHGVPARIPTRAPIPSPPTEAVEERPAHVVHQSHRGYGTDPSERARSREDAPDPVPDTISEDAAAIRRQLQSRSPSALRQALILQEVMGPPAAMRDDRF